MRKINFIVVHCTASHQTNTVKDIQRYWREVKRWQNPGYHYIIKADGVIVALQPEDKPSNGVAGHNSECVNVAYIGGIDSKGAPVDNRTDKQKKALEWLLTDLKNKYPTARIQGHRDFKGVAKACPCFDAIEEYKHIK